MKKTTFALYFGNRGFMPAELLSSARQEMIEAVENAGYDYLIMDEKATRYGAVETREEGRMIILGISEPPVRTLRATIPENERHIFR